MRQHQKITSEDSYPPAIGTDHQELIFGYQGKKEGYFQTLHQQHEAREKWALQFSNLIDTWDEPIRQSLNQLAQILWSPKYVLRLIPVSTSRLRHRQVGEVHVWWVERDIPPYDKYQCATYRVYMVLEDENQPFLAVQSGVGIYPVVPLTGENLNRNVAKAGQDPPVIISRTMGEIHD